MVKEQLLIGFLFIFSIFSIVYGVFIYRGKATKGVKVSITVLFSAYLAGKVLLESTSKFWGLLIPVLIFYLTEVSYYSYHLLLGLDHRYSNEQKFKLDLKNGIAIVLLLALFEIVPLLAVYYVTRNILISITVGLGSGLFFFTLPIFDEKVFKNVFDLYTLLLIVTTAMVMIYGT